MPLPSWRKVRLAGWLPVSRSAALRVLPTVLLHVTAFGLMLWSERGAAGKAAYLLAWGIANCFWLAVLRRPAAAAAVSLAFFSVLVLLSRFKYDVLFMTVSFVDLMVIDRDTFRFLMAVFPGLSRTATVVALLSVPAFILLWWFDRARVRSRSAALGGLVCLALLTALSFALPHDR